MCDALNLKKILQNAINKKEAMSKNPALYTNEWGDLGNIFYKISKNLFDIECYKISGESYINASQCYQHEKNLVLEKECYLGAIKCYKLFKDDNKKIFCYNLLIDHAQRINDHKSMYIYVEKICKLFEKFENYESIILYHTKIVDLLDKNNEKMKYIRSMTQIARNQFLLRKYDESIKNFNLCIDLCLVDEFHKHMCLDIIVDKILVMFLSNMFQIFEIDTTIEKYKSHNFIKKNGKFNFLQDFTELSKHSRSFLKFSIILEDYDKIINFDNWRMFIFRKIFYKP